MHIEPGLVADAKIWLSYATAAGGYTLKLAADAARVLAAAKALRACAAVRCSSPASTTRPERKFPETETPPAGDGAAAFS